MTRAGSALWRLACPLLISLAIGIDAVHASANDRPVTVFMAASLDGAVREVLSVDGAVTAQPVRFSVAASSLLARQIEAGAPADIYLSANGRWMDHLATRGLIDSESRRHPIGNRLVLVRHVDAAPWRGPLSALADRLPAGERLAVADPQHVPAGLYAREALEALGLWVELAPRLALSDNVLGTLALVASAQTPLGIVYSTDAALSRRVNVAARFPERSHSPIRYHFAIVAGRRSAPVQQLFDRLSSAQALAVYRRRGFTIADMDTRTRAQ